MASIQIDYDLLAAALVRQGSSGGAAVGQVGGVVASGAGVAGKAKVVAGAEPLVAGAKGAVAESVAAVEESCDEASVGESVSGESVSGGVGRAGDGVRKGVKFGGLQDDFPSRVAAPARAGFYATAVKTTAVKNLKRRITAITGAAVPKPAMVDLALCTYTAGVIPDAFAQGKQKLRSLAAIGDAAVTLHVVTDQWAKGNVVESAQAARSKLSSNKYFCAAMVKHGFIADIAYAGGVDPESSTATATAFEAIVGVLVLYREPSAVRDFLRYFGVIS